MQALLSATSEFYARESASWIGADSCPEYMKKVSTLKPKLSPETQSDTAALEKFSEIVALPHSHG